MYGYVELKKDIDYFTAKSRTVFIGKTVTGIKIPAFIVGEGEPRVLIFGAIHAREHITAALVSAQARAYRGRAVMFAPIINIDGVRLVAEGIDSAPAKLKKSLLGINGSADFSLWKANINGVDLNVNFDADWGTGKSNVFQPSSSNYIGKYPMSEPETRALIYAVKFFNIKTAIAYHAKGEVIYYGYKNGEDHKDFAEAISKVTAYSFSHSYGSAGGFKDWFVLNGGLCVTVEIGKDDMDYNELYSDFCCIYRQNKDVPQIAAEYLWK